MYFNTHISNMNKVQIDLLKKEYALLLAKVAKKFVRL